MADTGFAIPSNKLDRVAKPLPNNPDAGKPQEIPLAARPAKLECGGGCAVSTASDYIRFAQMLVNKGVLGNTRLLGRNTVEYMTANHLGPEVDNRLPQGFALHAGYGFGLGVAVRVQSGIAGVSGSPGDYNWMGAYGTYFWVDPKEQLAVVFMAQTLPPVNMRNRQLLIPLVMQSIID